MEFTQAPPDYRRAGQAALFSTADSDNAEVPATFRPSAARRLAVDRLILMERRHARHYLDQRYVGRPIGPHALAWFYWDPEIGHRGSVRAATRIFLDGPEVADLSAVLVHLRDLARTYDRTSGFDPRRQMTDRAEPMSHNARYLGLGVSSVVLPPSDPAARPAINGGPSAQRFETALPARGTAMLTDDTWIVAKTHGTIGAPEIASTHTLDREGSPGRTWRWLTNATPIAPEIAEGMAALHGVTASADGDEGIAVSTRRSRRLRRR